MFKILTNFVDSKTGRFLRSLALCLQYWKSKIKSSMYSQHYVEECNEWRGPSPRLSARATQLQRNVATVAIRKRHCVRLDRPGKWTQNLRQQ